MKPLLLIIPFAPLLGAIIAGFFGRAIGRAASHRITIALLIVSCIASFMVLQDVMNGYRFNGSLYTWMISDGVHFEVGFLIDALSAMMMVVVTFVSLMVHIYTIGYMAEDPGYSRFYSYISLFTFAM